MGLDELVRRERASQDEPRGGKALVVFYCERELLPHGGGLVVCFDADDAITAFITDGGAPSNGNFSVDEGGFDYDSYRVREPGAYVGRLRFVDGGPGDYPGSRETCVQLYDLRPATADEWKSHLDGEWPWDDKYGPF